MTSSNPLIQFHLKGSRALVTGGAAGIGFATAQLLAQSGAHVVINDLPGHALDKSIAVLRDVGLQVEPSAGDLGNPVAAAAVASHALSVLGGIDYLINNVGTPGTRSPIAASDLDALSDAFWDKILRVNLMSAFWMTKALKSQLIAARGAIVNTVSVAAFAGGGSSIAYVTAKAGLVGLTRELARGLAPHVRVNGIAPGLVNSAWECSFGDTEALAKQTIPLQSVGQPADYAEAIAYLCAGANYVTGEILEISGGAHL